MRFTSAQVSAPDLRCLQVLSNGDVKLTWIAPSDPSNQFYSYTIYSSINSYGPFTNIGTVSSISITNFTHVGASANTQSHYYYITTQYGSSGSSSSSGSFTLQSIFLNTVQNTGAAAVNCIYNNLKNPPLPSTANTFTLSRTYPIGVWNILSISSNTTYPDTISICSYSYNYVVEIADNSGCISSSNIQGGIYKNNKIPNQLNIDSISVMPNGQTVFGWHYPYDQTIVKYTLYQNIGGVATAFDTLAGINNTVYSFTPTTANTSTVGLHVSAIDSCGNKSTFDNQPYITMFLTATYDSCKYASNLNWNPYLKMPGGLKEYWIYYSVNGSQYIKIGTSNTNSFVHNNVSPGQNVCYFVRAVNTPANITASSNRTCFFSKQVRTSAFAYLRLASVLSKNNNLINFYVDTTYKFSGINLLRSEDNTNYSVINTQNYNGTSLYSFNDNNALNSLKPYYYKAQIIDACGNLRIYSNIAKTIFLTAAGDNEQTTSKKLVWTNYFGFNAGVSGYNVYRIINGVKLASPIGSTSLNDSIFIDNVIDESTNGSKIEHQVEAIESLGNIYGFQDKSVSNIVDVYNNDLLFIPNAFSPKGVNKTWKPIPHFIDINEYTVKVFNKWGNKVWESSNQSDAWNGENCTPDVYVYIINYKNSRGEYKEAKGSILLLE
ncbi:MAG: gliding motility-associated C-terminal domain-containing protein [Bacteroidetes bacterium]|nr:gliding motility-associated C-terminal domain-containing protein [Bacteroidota bacterium]